jgi:hypothetical protein
MSSKAAELVEEARAVRMHEKRLQELSEVGLTNMRVSVGALEALARTLVTTPASWRRWQSVRVGPFVLRGRWLASRNSR